MKILIYLSGILLLGAMVMLYSGSHAEKSRAHSSSNTRRPEIGYLEAVNKVAPPKDPQLLFLLMAQYSNANEQAEGVEFLWARLKEFGSQFTDSQKALYLSAIGLLRAQRASEVSLLHRIAYVKDTIATLDQAKQLSGGKIFVVNWMTGIVRAQLPGFFKQRSIAREELAWCEANADQAPHAVWLR